ncbi:nucleotide-binding universal stress UspA family protein [Kitasatospora sp. MAP12-15]|uniref:universal stress protein n=1 Tax=unclassified Kitasatospora TaxID=2633591 RepID=UPI00247560ED|nr:universal stress protein [Kitasatospora sp. MAP12-44]MDH6115053.1 nucleotide-binding universal stress UspA family protein [Kitasatospora sp. MAP12-44]
MAEGTRIIVGVSGAQSSPAVLRRAAEEAARRDAVLVPVIAWTPVGGEPAYRAHPCPPLAKVWEQAALDRLEAAFEQAFGGYPQGVRVEPMVIRGDAGAALVEIADRPSDLLVVGAGRRGRLPRLLRGSVSRYCLAHAACDVVAVPPADLPSAAHAAPRRSDRSFLVAA